MEELVKKLQEDVRELSLGTSTRVERLDSPPSPLCFLRNYVSPNKPCIISNAIQHWPALTTWTQDDDYLSQKLSQSIVSVHLTPDGQADALVPSPSTTSTTTPSLCFASAHTQPMPFPEALRLISSGSSEPFVAYAQEQNDCFRSEYSTLSSDVETHIPWATEALGCHPEAVNLWIGNHLSTTSFHKDHYENLYAVITGEKHFLLLPPTDVHRLYIRNYPAASYSLSQDTGELTLQLEEPRRQVPWCSINPYPPADIQDQEFSKFPLYFNGPKPFESTVKAGEILYLPSMWFHHVKQSPDNKGRTIALNYWYDMQFDIKYAYFDMWQSIRHELSSNELAVPEENSNDSATTNECNANAGSTTCVTRSNMVISSTPSEWSNGSRE